ncbi:VOC family protein [Ornithinicoccus hortensis]
MTGMRIDHVCYAAESDGMRATADRLAQRLGVTPRDGGLHPRFGTRNMILPLADSRYLEVVEVLDHPAADKAPFGQAVRARSEKGGGWMAWVVAVDDLTRFEEKLGRKAVEGHRHTPEGIDLTWRQVGIKGLLADPQLPFFVHWDSMEHHPSTLDESGVRLTALQINGDPSRIRDWLGLDRPGEFEKAIEFGFHGGEPALDAVTFEVDGDQVTL